MTEGRKIISKTDVDIFLASFNLVIINYETFHETFLYSYSYTLCQ